MTSGNFHSVEIASIVVHREERQRRDVLDDIDPLADSIRRLGLIHPICITRDLQLVAGERRLTAARALGWTHIPCHFTDELDSAVLRAIELEENVKRKDISWEDRSRAVLEYHELRRAEDTEWSRASTATALGVTEASVGQHIEVAKEIIKGNPKVLASARFSTARGIVQRASERGKDEALQALRGPTKPTVEDDSPIICADFLEWMKTYTGPKFNFVHCDFPYGIGANKQQQGGSVATHGGYSDTEDDYWRLCSGLGAFLDHHCAESVHVMFWFSMHYYRDTRSFFSSNCGLDFDPFPLIWVKSDNIGLLPDPQRGPRRIYETAFFGSRGDRKIVNSVSNAYSGPTDRSIHMSAKPEAMLLHFYRMFCDETTVGIDPTCGSGNSVRAGLALKAKSFIGIEKNEEFANLARMNLNKEEKDGRA